MGSQSDSIPACSPLAKRGEATTRSPIREMFDLAQSFDGEDLVHLEIGEPDFDTPEHIVEAAAAATRDGATHYTSNAGLPELRRAIADDLDGNYDPTTDIIVTAGAMEALSLAVLSLVDPSEELLVPTPTWPNYRTHTVIADAEFTEVALPAESGFALNGDVVADAISEETGAVILTNPSNPTGRVFDAEAIQTVTSAAAEHDAFVIADEVYKDLTYDGSFTSVREATDNPEVVVTLGSCSKTYAMTGWRVGWLAASERIVDAALKFHESLVACAPTVSQHAALEALEGNNGPVNEMYDAFAERRDYVVDRVDSLPGVSCPTPEGAFYAFLDISVTNIPSDEVAKRLLTENEVVTAPGTGFGTGFEDYIRISFANDLDRLAEGFDRIDAFLKSEGVR